MMLNSVGDRIIGNMLKNKGMEYVDKLKKQNVKLVTISGPATRDLIISGNSLCRRRSFGIMRW
jgi:hypothetical protein